MQLKCETHFISAGRADIDILVKDYSMIMSLSWLRWAFLLF